jgi:hypothetical protein
MRDQTDVVRDAVNAIDGIRWKYTKNGWIENVRLPTDIYFDVLQMKKFVSDDVRSNKKDTSDDEKEEETSGDEEEEESSADEGI